jgi:DNA-binding FadR family transcriptional regulator
VTTSPGGGQNLERPSLPQLRQPRVGEIIASALRERILTGELADGTELPKQEQLMDEFQVSMASAREALRILESEGLISVRRGNLGGSVVHRPAADMVAYMFGLVLETRSVDASDVAAALRQLEPTCAAMCARRTDRLTTVVPELESYHQQCLDAIEDPGRYVLLAGEFHQALVRGCGNGAMILIVGTLEAIWSSVLGRLAQRADEHMDVASREVREAGEAAHAELIEAIRRGDAPAASRLTARHLDQSHPVALASEETEGDRSLDVRPKRRRRR